MAEPTTPKKTAGPRLQHVAARRVSIVHARGGGGGGGGVKPATESDSAGACTFVVPEYCFDEVLVFGQKVDALEHIYQASGDWIYAAVAHGQSFVEQLKAVS